MKLHGNKNFHVNSISRSTRSLGKVHRNQRKRNTTLKLFKRNQIHEGSTGPLPPPKNRAVVMPLDKKTYAYSARKKKENFMPEYSV